MAAGVILAAALAAAILSTGPPPHSPVPAPSIPLPPTSTPAAKPSPSPSPSRSPAPSPPTPTPTPTPTPALTPFAPQLNLSPARAAARSDVTVIGTGYPPGQPVTVYLDRRETVLGRTAADATGAFSTVVTPDAPPGPYQVCADAPGPVPGCATLTLTAPGTPSPSASAGGTPEPDQPPPSPTAAPVAPRQSALERLLSPPWILLPLLLLAGAAAGIAYAVARPAAAPDPLPSATVTHRSIRPGRSVPPYAPPPPPADETADDRRHE